MSEPPLTKLGLDLLSFLWPAACLGCGSANRDWCADCRAQFHASHRNVQVTPYGGENTEWLASGVYSGMRKELIVRLKHQGQLGLAPHLGRALHGPLSALMRGRRDPPLIVPIPSRASRVRARGYRHLELILRNTGLVRTPRMGRILLPTRGRTGQVGLDERLRRENAGRLRLRQGVSVADVPVILVDDVVTTGATLGAAHTLLTGHGARVIGAATIAVALKLRETQSEQKDKSNSHYRADTGNV